MKKKAAEKLRDELGELVERLKTEKDELELQIHLAQADMHDEWDRVEERWQHLQAKSRLLMRSTADVSQDVGAAAQLLAQEIKRAFKRLRKLVKAAA